MSQFGPIPIYQTRFDRVLAITMTFALIGPPVGLITLVVSEPFRSSNSLSAVTLAGLGTALVATVSAIPFAYFFGAIPAAAAGLLVGICREWIGQATWWMALTVGIVVGIAFVWFLDRPPTSSTATPIATPLGFRLRLIAVNVVPTMLCWWIVRNWYAQRTPS